MGKIKEYIDKRKKAKKYISEYMGVEDRREQNNYLKLWVSSGMPDISTEGGPWEASFNTETNQMILPRARDVSKKEKTRSFVEELGHARQYKSMRSPFRPLNTEEKWIDDIYKFDPFDKHDNIGPSNMAANMWGGGLYSVGKLMERADKKMVKKGYKGVYGNKDALPTKIGKNIFLIGHLASLLGNKLGKYKTIKEERAKSNIMHDSFHNEDTDWNIKSVQSDEDYLKSMEGWKSHAYKQGKLSDHYDEYHSPWTTESMAHTQLDPGEGHEIDNYSGEKDTRSISDMIRGEFDILSEGDDNYLNKAFQNIKWLVDHTKNTIKVNEVMGKKWEKDYNKDVRSFVGEALRYE
tara:strand:- start:1115 stop:2164 length:1050 start_codon:yes stop_codon:yes gene_type:complete